jgi:hypothetical protein
MTSGTSMRGSRAGASIAPSGGGRLMRAQVAAPEGCLAAPPSDGGSVNGNAPSIPAPAGAAQLSEPSLIARANELHRAGIVQRCAELFRIVAKLKADVLRKRAATWKEYVATNFTFSLATADNYARIGHGPNPLGAAPVRHLHASGRPGYQKPEPKVTERVPTIKSVAPDVVDAEIVSTRTKDETTAPLLADPFVALAAHIPHDPKRKGPPGSYRWTEACSTMRTLAMMAWNERKTYPRAGIYSVVLLMDLLGVEQELVEYLSRKLQAGDDIRGAIDELRSKRAP